jgi:hypothetical protein
MRTPVLYAILAASLSSAARAAQVDCILHGNSPGEHGVVDSTGAGCTDEDRQWYKDNKAKIDALKKEMQPETDRDIAQIRQETEANQRAMQEEYKAAAAQQAAQRAEARAANLRAQQDAYQRGAILKPYAANETDPLRAIAQPAPAKELQRSAVATTKPTDPFAPAMPWESAGDPLGAGLRGDPNAAACIQEDGCRRALPREH